MRAVCGCCRRAQKTDCSQQTLGATSSPAVKGCQVSKSLSFSTGSPPGQAAASCLIFQNNFKWFVKGLNTIRDHLWFIQSQVVRVRLGFTEETGLLISTADGICGGFLVWDLGAWGPTREHLFLCPAAASFLAQFLCAVYRKCAGNIPDRMILHIKIHFSKISF